MRPKKILRFYRKAIPPGCHPLVAALVEAMNDRRLDFPTLGEKAGVCPRTIAEWRYSRTPNLTNFIAAAEAVGLEVVVQRKDPTS